MKIINKILTGTALVILTACGRDSYYIAENPNEDRVYEPGLATVGTTGGTGGEQKESTILLTAASGEVFTLTHGKQSELEAGNYRIVVAAPAAGSTAETMKQLSIQGTTVSLVPDANGLLPAAPHFEAGVGNLTIAKYTETKADVALHPMTREVAFEAIIKGAAISEVSPISISLSGVSASADINKGFAGTAGDVASRNTTRASGYSVVTALAATEGGTLLKGTIRLLGLDVSGTQKIIITGTRADGTHPLFEMDVTSLLSGFNDGKATVAHTIAMELTYDTQAGLTGNILPWTPGWESDVTN